MLIPYLIIHLPAPMKEKLYLFKNVTCDAI